MYKTHFTEYQVIFMVKSVEARHTIEISTVESVSLKLPTTTESLNTVK